MLITYKAVNGHGPDYICDLLEFYKPSEALRSATDNLMLKEWCSNLKTGGDLSFAVAAPALWNRLPYSLRSANTIDSFKIGLKI